MGQYYLQLSGKKFFQEKCKLKVEIAALISNKNFKMNL